MKRRLLAVLAMASLLLSAVANAQATTLPASGTGGAATVDPASQTSASTPTSAPVSLSFAQALKAVLQAPAVATASADLAIANSRLAARQAAVHASVSVGSSANLALAGDTTISASVSGSATFDVLPYGPSQDALERAQASVARASATLADTTRSTRVSVATEYLTALRASQEVALQQEALTLADANLQAAQARNQAGAASDADVLSAQIDVASATDDLATAKRDARKALAALSQTLGIQVTAVAGDPAVSLDTSRLAANATLDDRSDVVGATLDVASAELDLQAARRDAGISASATLSFATSTNDAGITLSTSFDTSTLQPSAGATLTVGANGSASTSLGASVGVTIPLDSSSGATLRAYQQAVTVAEQQLTSTRNAAAVEIADARRNLQGEQAQLELQTQLVAQADATLTRTKVRYDLGLVSVLDVQNASLTLHQAQLARDRADDATLVAGLQLAQSMAIDPMELLQ